MFSLTQLWYAPRWYHWPIIVLLLPLTLLFAILAKLRRLAFRLGLKVSSRAEVPVIIVGNISVGGNGKTPMVVFLAQFLSEQGYQPGVLTRGYGGKSSQYPKAVTEHSIVTQVGDEPMLMRQHISCPLVVDPVRTRGAQFLVKECKCDVIICDDGLQHYALKRDIEIVVIDGKRRLGNGLLLPAGPLREGAWRLQQADFVVINGKTQAPSEYAMSLEAGDLINVKDPRLSRKVTSLVGPVTALAGIGHPQRFFDLLASYPLEINKTISFVDHHQFSADDLPNDVLIMTEKDAVKCRDFAHQDCWYLPVKAQLSAAFSSEILAKLRTINASN
ncbi:MAG: tetraacyldisaccharide 4'-kinase [Paraglaciecola sp.]|uniref:tetraacyldisaccharide 4'-kinase n=1 Tax=Paraglaciecola sp. TaxID=1920173 RepID=UPI00273F19CF|nr:tetraacyldisaccharide 4'-kinase [Paraglaciecola sp.]MDP5033030.1 tetraacyldisaccharide 4'-kinase [Paraglaciecola sp.]MDP5129820.1 tetraacyldisaccharide 4'-kinase [Paraglaciecola sp.]